LEAEDAAKGSVGSVQNGRRGPAAAASLRSGKRHLCVEKTCGRGKAREG
jgi:hypothetical protein